MSPYTRRLPIGAEVQSGGGTHFRAWSPDHREISVVIESARGDPVEVPLAPEPCGYASAFVAEASAGDRYRFRVGGDLLADPASRFQPDGPFGPSAVVDPGSFRWTDQKWSGRELAGQVLYEMHCGTFTSAGTWRAAIEQLPELARLGVTVIEAMPVAEFPGEFGWGYDGVFPYAPTRLYGVPDDLRAFVNAAHELGLAVILDVVYNHLGPDGCVFSTFAQAYFTRKYSNEWGEALNFDGANAFAVREYFVANAGYWVDEYHLDGLRLDATQSIHDASEEHVIAAIGRRVRQAAGGRTTILISENEQQQTRMVRPVEQGGYGLDALWNDDFRHSAVVALTGRSEAYYSDHRGVPQEFISAARHGYLFQGQRYAWQKQPRGTRTDGIPPAAFVTFLENHDQVANSGDGSRLHRKSAPGCYRAMTALLLLMPGTPMLFQGQEMGSSRPFLYFADHGPEIAEAVRKGRAEFVSQFPSLASETMRAQLAVPHDRATFERCKLDWHERETNAPIYRLHRDLLELRRSDHAFRAQAAGAVDGAVIGPLGFVLRFAAERDEDERLLLVNLGTDLVVPSLAEPLVAPPEDCEWKVRFSTEEPAYGGHGTPPVVTDAGWRIPGHAAIVLEPMPCAVQSSGKGARDRRAQHEHS
jgi:maltooligosyltrehalose trehalohydrolase